MIERRVEPIDIDFAGWSVVEAGEHNAWGVIEARDGIDHLVSHHPVKCAADERAKVAQ